MNLEGENTRDNTDVMLHKTRQPRGTRYTTVRRQNRRDTNGFNVRITTEYVVV